MNGVSENEQVNASKITCHYFDLSQITGLQALTIKRSFLRMDPDAEFKTSVYLIPEVKRLYDLVYRRVPKKKAILNAAVWLFSQASREDQDRALDAVSLPEPEETQDRERGRSALRRVRHRHQRENHRPAGGASG
jgi:hypothetical protein